MAKVTDTIKNLAIQAGVDTEDAGLKTFLGNASLASIGIPDEIANKIQSGLLTIESAKANPSIKKHFTSEFETAYEKELDSLVSDDLKDKWNETKKNEKKLADKIKAYNKLVTENETGKVKSTFDKDKSTLATEIENLNKQVSSAKEAHKAEVEKISGERSLDKINWELNSQYNGYQYALEKKDGMNMPKDACIITAKQFVDSKMKELGLNFIADENGNLALRTTVGTKYMPNNKEISAKDFISKTLTDANLLQVSAPKKEEEYRRTPTSEKESKGISKVLSKNEELLRQQLELQN